MARSANIFASALNQHARGNCVLIITDVSAHGIRGMDVACVFTFFSFQLNGKYFLCAVVRWFHWTGDVPECGL
jgi:hypothetical protein